jgi:hypothetical protein
MGRAGAGGGERQNTGASADVGDALAGEVETIDESGERLAADEKSRMKHRRPDSEPESRRTRGAGGLPRQHEMVGEKVDDPAQQPAERPVGRAVTVERIDF